MENILYLDPVGGISGDMSVASMLDLGVPISTIKKSLLALGIDKAEVSVSARKARSGSMGGIKFNVNPKPLSDSHRKSHSSRSYASISRMIKQSSLSKSVKDMSLEIFTHLARAEANVHGVDVGSVHFHEVGAIDSIVDIVGFASCVYHLNINKILVGSLPLGTGKISTTSHGKLPLPAPATLLLLKGFQVYGIEDHIETITPTGAAILSALAEPATSMPAMKLNKVGVGVGSRKPKDGGMPNVLRALLGSEITEIHNDEIYVINTNIDDMNPQDYDMLMEQLFEAGALDVALVNTHMKRNRPGIILEVQAPLDKLEAITETTFKFSTTIGLRYYKTKRITLPRKIERVQSSLGEISVKSSLLNDGKTRVVPEHKDLMKAAKKSKVSLDEARKVIGTKLQAEAVKSRTKSRRSKK